MSERPPARDRADGAPPDVLLLSPHADDIALSLGASLCERCLGDRVTVLVVFSVSRYTRQKQLRASLFGTTLRRMVEERRAARRAGYTVRFLWFGEPFVRPGFSRLDEVCDPARRVQADSRFEAVRRRLLVCLRRHRGVVVGPLACGDHIDHRIVKHVLQEHGRQAADTVPWFYEDLPYAAGLKDAEISSLAPHGLGGHRFARRATHAASLEGKLRLMQVYRSQETPGHVSAVKAHWARRGGETVWVPECHAERFGRLVPSPP